MAPRLSDARPGEILSFGRFSQTADGTVKTPLQWRVLQNTGVALFLLSEYIVDCKRYHNQSVATNWRNCDLRAWLNGEFFEAAFSATEQQRIAATICTDNGAGSPDTRDTVFLLSVAEIKSLTTVHDGPLQRRTIATEYAKVKKADGCYLYVYDKSVEQDYVIVDGVKRGCSWWWTRTQLQIDGGCSTRAAFIGARSNIKSYGEVDQKRCGVRPALTLDLRE